MGFHKVSPGSIAKFNSAFSCDFLDKLESHIDEDILAENSKPSSKTFAPSSFRCSRAMWFRLRGTQPDQPNKADRVLKFKADMGTACHRVLQKYISEYMRDNWISLSEYLSNNPIPYKYNLREEGYETLVEVTEPYPIRFACDGILKFNETYSLLEIKSSESDSFHDLTDPKPHHIDQVKCYCTILGLSRVLFLYIDRTYGDLKCYDIKVSDSDKQDVLEKFKSITWAAEYNIAPDPLPKGDSWCTPSFCPYYKKCKEW